MVWFFFLPKKESKPVPQEFHSPLTSLRNTLTHQEHQLFLMVKVSILSIENSAMRSPVSFISRIIIQFNQMAKYRAKPNSYIKILSIRRLSALFHSRYF